MISQRIRDPIHDVITFDDKGLVDEVAWKLLQTRDMQRLRRVKQLGVSEFVFPGASHTRFAHSIGVFHIARQLVEIIRREIGRGGLGMFDDTRAKTALCAAMLHDIGHGPFSHAFEVARKSLAGKERKIDKHEAFTAFMIEDPAGEIGAVLTDAGIDPHAVAELIRAETPQDMYHAVVSSSFDADRLDYLQRDRHMTGTGAGAIDIGWLMENVRVAEIDVAAPETDDEIMGSTFCLDIKARDAAEDFLLARYRLFTNVYLHKTTRGIEQLVAAFFRQISREIHASGHVGGLDDRHPLVLFFSSGGETLENYRELEDTVVWGAIHAVARLGSGALQDIACRLRDRVRPRCIDLQRLFPDDDNHQVSVKKPSVRCSPICSANASFRTSAPIRFTARSAPMTCMRRSA